MSAPFLISKLDSGKMAEHSREVFKEQFAALESGLYLVAIEPFKERRFSPTRYKWWFDCVLGLALPKVRQHFGMIDRHGQVRYPDTVKQLHDILKLIYNPVTIVMADGGMLKTIGYTTREMPDNEFLNEFAEIIIADLSGAPYYAFPDTGCPDRNEWAEMRKAGEWVNFKKQNN